MRSWRSATIVASVVCLFVLWFPSSVNGEEPEPLSTETPGQLAEKVADDGVYVSPARGEVDPEPLIAAVSKARERNLRLVIIAPENPEPDADAFARRMQEVTEADAAVVIPPDGAELEGYAAEDFSDTRTRALGQARKESDVGRALSVYIEALDSESSGSVPLFAIGLIAFILVLLYVAYAAASWEQKLRKEMRNRRRQAQ